MAKEELVLSALPKRKANKLKKVIVGAGAKYRAVKQDLDGHIVVTFDGLFLEDVHNLTDEIKMFFGETTKVVHNGTMLQAYITC